MKRKPCDLFRKITEILNKIVWSSLLHMENMQNRHVRSVPLEKHLDQYFPIAHLLP